MMCHSKVIAVAGCVFSSVAVSPSPLQAKSRLQLVDFGGDCIVALDDDESPLFAIERLERVAVDAMVSSECGCCDDVQMRRRSPSCGESK